MKFRPSILKRNYAVLLLFVMSIQYIPIEGWTISPLKVALMVTTPFIWMVYSRKAGVEFVLAFLYLLWAFITSYFINGHSFRASTYLYHVMFVVTFCTYCSLVMHNHVFTPLFYTQLIEKIMTIFVAFALLQQVCIVVGIHYFPLINLVKFLGRGIGCNSLSFEPSSFARIMAFLFLALLRMYQLQLDRCPLTLKWLYRHKKWLMIVFLWSMLTMGSGTAFVCLLLLSVYFAKRQYVLIAVPVAVLSFYSISHIENESVQRAYKAIVATSTLDADQVVENDTSAAVRIVPILNTLSLDLSDPEVWLGRGIDSAINSGHFSKEITVGGISDYGLLSYLLFLILVISVIFIRTGLTEWILFIVLLGGSANNISYSWGCLMVMAGVSYFRRQAARGCFHRAPSMFPRVPHRLAERGGA